MRRVLIIASGGGHTGFARAIAQFMPFKVDFVVPEGDRQSVEVLKPYANAFYEVVKGREPGEPLSKLLVNLPKAVAQSFALAKYDVVIATGSNHSIFPSLAEKLKGAKVFAVESQDRFVTKGKAVSIISSFAERVFLHWEAQKKLYPKKGRVVGPIVERPKYTPKDEGFVLVTTGSMGFMRLYQALSKLGMDNVVIQTGRVRVDDVKALNPRWEVFSFDPDIERWISRASVVVTHQGKTAMEAVVMYQKPTVIVYNRDWKQAASFKDSRLYAETLGAAFLDDPSKWESAQVLKKALEEVRPPKKFEVGTPKLVEEVLR